MTLVSGSASPVICRPDLGLHTVEEKLVAGNDCHYQLCAVCSRTLNQTSGFEPCVLLAGSYVLLEPEGRLRLQITAQDAIRLVRMAPGAAERHLTDRVWASDLTRELVGQVPDSKRPGLRVVSRREVAHEPRTSLRRTTPRS